MLVFGSVSQVAKRLHRIKWATDLSCLPASMSCMPRSRHVRVSGLAALMNGDQYTTDLDHKDGRIWTKLSSFLWLEGRILSMGQAGLTSYQGKPKWGTIRSKICVGGGVLCDNAMVCEICDMWHVDWLMWCGFCWEHADQVNFLLNSGRIVGVTGALPNTQ